MITLEGLNEYNGFQLKDIVEITKPISVFTGLNGSGKTRLLQSMKNEQTQVNVDGEILDKESIIIVPGAAASPVGRSNPFKIQDYDNKLILVLQMYDQMKKDLEEPFDQNKVRNFPNHSNPSLPHNQKPPTYAILHKIFNHIATQLGKSPSELTHNEIKLHYNEPQNNLLANPDFTKIFNEYIKRCETNELNQFKASKGKKVTYYESDEFVKAYGEKPWEIANRILDKIFKGKFQYSVPDENSESYTYVAVLIDQETKSEITPNNQYLSSGERTLLWLANTLFTSFYFNNSDLITKPKLLLLDEPDGSLHPQMIIQLFEVLEIFNQNFNSSIVFTTHSPTTVALADEESVYVVKENNLAKVDRDTAIAELLTGVTQISINPENRKQVFVESMYDANIYQALFTTLVHMSNKLDPKLTLTFVSSGPKMPEQLLIDKAKQILGVTEEKIITEFVDSINGVGNCDQVTGSVESLIKNGNSSVRGIIDWDSKNKSTPNVKVLAESIAYAIENVALDPIAIMLLLHTQEPLKFKMKDLCGQEVLLNEVLENETYLQTIVDNFILKVLCRKNQQNVDWKYVSGITVKMDSEYLVPADNGHQLEAKLVDKYPELKRFWKNGKDGALKEAVITKSMITLSSGRLIPEVFENILIDVQRS